MKRSFATAVICLALVGVASVLVPSPALAAETSERPFKLMVGDKAPALSIGNWVKGSPVKSFEPGKVYVVEFWATWCGPCIRNIPHVNEIQKKYADKGLTVISVTSPDPRNTLAKVTDFVAKQGDKMNYIVAFDDSRRNTDRNWMDAAGQTGIPAAFVVDQKGRMAWIGHPYYIDDVLAEIVAGTHDIEKEAKAYANKAQVDAQAVQLQEKFMKFATGLIEEKKYDESYTLGRKLVDGDAKSNPELLGTIAWLIVDPQQAHDRRDLSLAMDAAQRAVKMTQWQDANLIDTLAWCYYHKNDFAKAVEIEKRALGAANEDILPFVTNSMATFKDALAQAE